MNKITHLTPSSGWNYSEVMYKMTIFKDYSENFISLIRMYSYKLQRRKPFWGWCPQTYYVFSMARQLPNCYLGWPIDYTCYDDIHMSSSNSSLDLIHSNVNNGIKEIQYSHIMFFYLIHTHFKKKSQLKIIDIINTTHFKHQTNRCTTHTYFVNIYIGVYYSCSIGIDSNDNNKVLINFHEGNYCNTYWTRF
ncbi:hypothetical protein AGLY_010470 [Aphis glycines]|uniref:Uncharacterized protein n=1 Tax=Aphis glycines TaxID=307491 RepID=A0A6G0TE91_APHGL|nr:hypothetical protein AGLY_010470 [Aphis glycines]